MRTGRAAGSSAARPAARPRRARKRRIGPVVLGAAAAVVSLSIFLGLTAQAIVTRRSCSAHPVAVHVAASSEIGPAIGHLARYFNSQHHDIGGHCAEVVVVVAAPAVVAARLSGQAGHTAQAGHTSHATPPVDAWIPDSSLWVGLARESRAGARQVQAAGASLASSPLMIVMPRAASAQVPAFGSSVGWRFLLPASAGGPGTGLGLHVMFPRPTQSTAGLATLLELRRILGTGAAGRRDLTSFVFNVLLTAAPSGRPALAALTRVPASPQVTVTSEQQVASYDKAHPAAPLSARYPADGTYDLDYPYTLTTSDPLRARAAAAFGTLLRSSYAAAYFRYEGFRSAGGIADPWPASSGLAPVQPVLTAPAAAGAAASALVAWQRLSLGSRDLTLIDVSSAMAARASRGGPTLEQELNQAASIGLAQFPDSTQLGVWAFASHLDGSRPYHQVISVGPLPAALGLVTRRQQVRQAALAARPVPHAAAGLYPTILAAYRYMVASYQPRYENAVLVMTAGVDSERGDISAAKLVRELRGLASPSRKVQVIIIKFGRSGNLTALRQIAAATGGQAFAISSPGQITRVFFSAVAQRLCQPGCPGQ